MFIKLVDGVYKLKYENDNNHLYDISDQLAHVIGNELKKHGNDIYDVEVVITLKDKK